MSFQRIKKLFGLKSSGERNRLTSQGVLNDKEREALYRASADAVLSQAFLMIGEDREDAQEIMPSIAQHFVDCIECAENMPATQDSPVRRAVSQSYEEIIGQPYKALLPEERTAENSRFGRWFIHLEREYPYGRRADTEQPIEALGRAFAKTLYFEQAYGDSTHRKERQKAFFNRIQKEFPDNADMIKSLGRGFGQVRTALSQIVPDPSGEIPQNRVVNADDLSAVESTWLQMNVLLNKAPYNPNDIRSAKKIEPMRN